MKVIIFTDGAARGNPDGPGGYGAIVRLQNAQGQTLEKELSGGYPHTTNNRMELMGVIAALEEIGRLGEPCEGVIYSDSRSFDDTAAPLTQASEWLSAGSAEAGQDTAAAAEPVRTSSRLSGTSQTSRTEPVQTIRVRYLSDQIEKLQPPTNSANWVDLRSAEDVELKKGDFRLISLGVAMKLPEGYEAHIVPRSSTYKNFGIIQANHHGVVDNSYCGDGDLWRMPVIAMRDTHIHINDRICQFRIERRQPDLIFEEVEHLDSEDRGGFGSTGVR